MLQKNLHSFPFEPSPKDFKEFTFKKRTRIFAKTLRVNKMFASLALPLSLSSKGKWIAKLLWSGLGPCGPFGGCGACGLIYIWFAFKENSNPKGSQKCIKSAQKSSRVFEFPLENWKFDFKFHFFSHSLDLVVSFYFWNMASLPVKFVNILFSCCKASTGSNSCQLGGRILDYSCFRGRIPRCPNHKNGQ